MMILPRIKKLKTLVFGFMFVNIFVFSQNSVGVFNLQVKNISHHNESVINNAIFNFIKEAKNYTVFDMRTSKLSSEEAMKKFDYVFTGELTGLKNGVKLKLILKQSSSGITRTIYKTYRNSNLILLDSRLLVSNLFDRSVELETSFDIVKIDSNTNGSQTDIFGEVLNLSSLSGSWHSDGEFERIEIMRGGRAVAILPSGVSIFLQLKLVDGYLHIKQSSAPLPRQFVRLPDEIARKFANYGWTPSWKFLVSKDNKILSGEKLDTEVVYSDNNIISTKEIVKQISWVRE